MVRERSYNAIDPVAFTADGESNGVITIVDTFCFKVKMAITLEADGLKPLGLQVKRVLNSTQMIVGPISKGLKNKTDVSAYILAINPTVSASEQQRPDISNIDYERAVYEEEPVVAKRVYNVDKYGKPYTEDNPLPVSDGNINTSARYVEATYSNGDKTVTYEYYESSAKVTLYNTIVINYSKPVCQKFTNMEW